MGFDSTFKIKGGKIMAFKRREGLAGGGINRYADQKIHNCPFCGTNSPNWLTDAYVANYSLISSKCINGYKFQCEKCGGIFEIQGNTDFCFQNESFTSVKLISSGNGTQNIEKIGVPITIHDLKMMSMESVAESPRVVAQPQPETKSSYQQLYQQHQPTYQQPSYQYPNYSYKKPSTAGKVLSLISMITGIVILAITFLFFLVSLDYLEMGVFAFSFGIYGVAPIILGAIGAGKSGNEKGKAITGIILGALSIFFGFVALCSFISYATYY